EVDMSEAETQQWTMEPPPYAAADAHAESAAADVDPDAPTQQWTMPPPPAESVGQDPRSGPPQSPPPSGPPPSGPPPGPPEQGTREYEPPPPPPNNNMRWIWAAAAVVVAGVVIAVAYFATRPSGGPAPSAPEAAPTTAPTSEPARGCDYPAQVLNLAGCNLTVPTLGEADQDDEDDKSDAEKAADKAAGNADDKKAKEVNQPELATFKAPPYFQVTQTCDSVAFRAPVNGITTSGSKYPRSELREMSPTVRRPPSGPRASGRTRSWSTR